MKKSNKRLVLKRETVAAMALPRAAGGVTYYCETLDVCSIATCSEYCTDICTDACTFTLGVECGPKPFRRR